MSASGCDLQRALGAFLALDVAQVERLGCLLGDFRFGARQHLRALEVVGDLNERGGRDDLKLGARPCRFRAAGRRTDQPVLARVRTNCCGQHACDRRNRAVEAEFAEYGEIRQGVGGNRADRRHQAERDGKVVMAAFLWQIGGREIDGDAARRQCEA